MSRTLGRGGLTIRTGPGLFLVLCLLVAPAHADFYLGLRLGDMNIDGPTRENPTNAALYLGYQLDNRLADVSIAAEVNRSTRRGETRSGEDLEFESEAIYVEVTTTSSLFATFRTGYLYDNIVIDDRSDRGSGLLLGAGIGFVSGSARFRLEFTRMAGDADFISLGVQF